MPEAIGFIAVLGVFLGCLVLALGTVASIRDHRSSRKRAKG